MVQKRTLESAKNRPLSVVQISAPMRDYRIAWLLNKQFLTAFYKTNSLIVNSPLYEQPLDYSIYEYTDEDEQNFMLLSNRFENTLLDAELPHVDYFFIMRDAPSTASWPKEIRKIRGVTLVQIANAASLVRIQNILDELELQLMQRKKETQQNSEQ